MTSGDRRTPVFGPEPWATFANAAWCHFDRWFALTAVAEFAGDLDQLEANLVLQLRSSLHSRRDVEAKLSHLTDLRDRLAVAGVHPAELGAAEAADKVTIAKARRKVLEQALEGRAMTTAMRDTPRARLEHRARYGAWPAFPVNPHRWYRKLAGRPSAFVTKGRSFAVTGELAQQLANYDGQRRPHADRLALYRAFHTVGLELADRADDSYGNIGELRREAFRTYLDVGWASAGMSAEHYWHDLCELLVCEPYALIFGDETLPFRRVPAGQGEIVETTLVELSQEWRAAYQDYQADEAVQLIAWLHIAGRRYSRYIDVARRLGSDHWIPIVALAESALAGQRHQLAVDVFRAADQHGMHRDHLRDRCRQLTDVTLDPGAPLRRGR